MGETAALLRARLQLIYEQVSVEAPNGNGGFGLSRSERMQRIDITGHAASAFLKSLENEIECPALAS
jgi:hypothetical protein